MSPDSSKRESDAPDAAQISRDAAADLFNLALLFALVLLFFLDVVLRGQVLFAGDIMNVYSPWQKYNQEALAAGRMPLWTDDFFTGFPLFAESQGALFYPPTRLIYCLVPIVHAFSFDVLLHFLLAGWFQYFLARTLRLPPPAALLSAIAFGFSGMFLSLPINFTIFRSIVWIPCIFMFVTMAARRGSLVFPLLAAVAMVMQMMGGSLQVTFITVLALVPYVVFLMLSPGKGKQASAVPLLQFVLVLMLAAGLYAFQLVPTLELMKQAWRGTHVSYELAASFSFPPFHFIDALFPTFYGIWKDGSMLPVVPVAANFFPYIGLAPLLLIPVSFGSRRRGVFIMFVLVVLFLALAVGEYGLMYPAMFHTVPFFGVFRAPDRFWMIAVFAGSLMAGYGLDRLVSGVESGKRGASLSGAGLVAVVSLLAALFVLGASYLPALRALWQAMIGPLIALFFNPADPPFDPGILERWRVHLLTVFLHALLAVTCFHYALALFGRKGRGGALAVALIVISIADIYAMSFEVPALRTTEPSFFTDPPRTAQVLRRDGDPHRFFTFGTENHAQSIFHAHENEDATLWYNGGGSDDIEDYIAFREALSPNISMHWGLTSANGFASLFLDRYFELERAAKVQLWPLLEIWQESEAFPSDWADRTLLIDLMAARYVLTPIDFAETDRFTLVDDGPVRVYHNSRALPRAWVARPESVLAETHDSLKRLADAGLDPTRTLILDPLPMRPRVYPEGSEGTATARVRLSAGAQGTSARGGAIIDEQVLIDIYTPQPAYLVLADTFYRDWYAEVDNQPVEGIYRAFGYFRAIEIPQGEHLVRFYYRPQSFIVGSWLTKVTVGTFIVLLFIQAFFFSRPRPEGTRRTGNAR